MTGCRLAHRARRLARDLDRRLACARAPNLDRELDRDLALVLDHACALARALDDHGGAASPLALAENLVLVLSRTRNLACARPRARNLIHHLNRALHRARHLARDLPTGRYLTGAVDHGRRRTDSDPSGPPPSPLQRGVIAIALKVLPPPDRDRYREESHAELVDLPSRQRLAHSLRILSRAWQLQQALRESPAHSDNTPTIRAKR